MKRKVWNKTSVPSTRATGLWIRVHPKSGGITFSSDLAKLLDLKNNGINFIQDEDRPADWYLEKSNDKEAFQVRAKKVTTTTTDKSFIVQSSALARAILSSAGVDAPSARFLVAGEPIDENVYAVITKSAQNKKLKVV